MPVTEPIEDVCSSLRRLLTLLVGLEKRVENLENYIMSPIPDELPTRPEPPTPTPARPVGPAGKTAAIANTTPFDDEQGVPPESKPYLAAIRAGTRTKIDLAHVILHVPRPVKGQPLSDAQKKAFSFVRDAITRLPHGLVHVTRDDGSEYHRAEEWGLGP